MRLLNNRDDAEDVLQSTWWQVWTSALRFDAELASAESWLMLLTRTRAIDHLRRRGTRSAAEAEAGPRRKAFNTDTPPERIERRSHIAELLADLPPEQREALRAAYYDGVTHEEIAARFQAPLGTVKSRIKRGMERMRGQLEDSTEGVVAQP